MRHLLDMKPGDIYLTRNTDEVGNNTPGFWNHAAICTDIAVVEAQRELDSVIAVDIESFRARYPEFVVLRPYSEQIGFDAADEASALIGTPYGRFPWFERGVNCVYVVRTAYRKVWGFDPRWKIPDAIFSSAPDRLYVVEHYKDYENWVKPDSWWNGRIT